MPKANVAPLNAPFNEWKKWSRLNPITGAP